MRPEGHKQCRHQRVGSGLLASTTTCVMYSDTVGHVTTISSILLRKCITEHSLNYVIFGPKRLAF